VDRRCPRWGGLRRTPAEVADGLRRVGNAEERSAVWEGRYGDAFDATGGEGDRGRGGMLCVRGGRRKKERGENEALHDHEFHCRAIAEFAMLRK
jgi:hypothetical protein